MRIVYLRRFCLYFFLVVLIQVKTFGQRTTALGANAWVDSVFGMLSEDEKIAQLMVVRLSAINTSTREVTFYDKDVEDAIRQFNIGGICLFQGGPVKQANFINYFQHISKTPILIAIDAENGVGMRMDSVKGLPRMMMLGAVQDSNIIYQYGRWVGEQCKRMGIQVNYAPVVDVNNNPNNPVINDRSFGENKFKVAQYGILYMKGMQDVGIMACAKHFPGHGDVEVDSHFDLPVISKSRTQLDSLELYPFREMFKAGVGSVMVAHLYIPSIDDSPNRATSISYNNVTKLMREEMNYQGLTFTDALEMRGVAKYYPEGAASVESLIAGNDMLCLPGDVASTIKKIKDAVRKKRLSWEGIDARVKKVLHAKYQYGLQNWSPVDTNALADDLNKRTKEIRKQIAEKAITVVRYENREAFPLAVTQSKRIAYLGLGVNDDNAFAKRMRSDYNADVFYFDYKQSTVGVPSLVETLRTKYETVIIGVHSYSRFPARNFNISEAAVELIKRLDAVVPTTVLAFGNPYAIKNFCKSRNIIVCYEDEDITQQAAADILNGKITAEGKLPVSVCDNIQYGTGINTASLNNDAIGSSNQFKAIDSIANDAIAKKATPGCVVLAAKDGRIVYHKAYGYFTYDSTESVSVESIYDMASVTKICATNLAVMKLYDQGKLDLGKRLGDYLNWVKGSDKENLVIEDILLHQARLKSWIPFYKETIDTNSGKLLSGFYARNASNNFKVRVADSVFMESSWVDTMYGRILQSPLEKPGQYIYSDNDFIFLGKIVEAVTGMSLDEYVMKEFYIPLGLVTPGFTPRSRFELHRIAPTENDKAFRHQVVRGDVHDPGAAMFGGVAGHAGLFSDAYDIAVLMQMLLNKGTMNGKRFLSDTTISLFTSYNSSISRRGLGFDKPEKDNASRKEPYPCLSVSAQAFGHTGFTGTCAWADPKNNLIFVFLSNRVYPDVSTKLLQMNVRGKMQEVFYEVLK